MAVEAKFAELKVDEGQEKEFLELDNRLDVQFRQAVLQGLPRLALQMDKLHAKCVAITLDQSGLPKPDEQIVAFVAEANPICQEAIELTHLIECRIRRLSSDVRLSAEVLIGEVIQRSLVLAEALRRNMEDLASQLNNYHMSRSFHLHKMLKYAGLGPEALAEYDRRFVAMVKAHLVKARNMIAVTLHKILSENLDNLTREHPKNGPSGTHHSSLYY